MTSISQKAVSLIKNGQTISLGGGSNVFKLAQEIKNTDLKLNLVTPSELTLDKVKKLGLKIDFINDQKIDLAFDGCDSIDSNFNALKSGGGIHLWEKIAAQNSHNYVILTSREKLTVNLNPKVPLTLEVAPPCAKLILLKLAQLKLTGTLRLAIQTATYVRTPQGNLLIDIQTKNWDNIKQINDLLLIQNGVIASSYFENLVTKVVTTDQSNNAIILERGNL